MVASGFVGKVCHYRMKSNGTSNSGRKRNVAMAFLKMPGEPSFFVIDQHQGFRQKKSMGGTIRKHKFAKKGDLSSEHFLEGLH